MADIILVGRVLLGSRGSLGSDLELADLVFGQTSVVGVFVTIVLLLGLMRRMGGRPAVVGGKGGSTVTAGGMEVDAVW